MTNERSPRFPSHSLPDALVHAEKLYASVGRSAVNAEISVTAIGYQGINGASRTALAVLAYYGLTQREGDKHRISDLALRLIRPLNPADQLEAGRIAVEKPVVFSDIAKNHADCAEPALASILLHAGFTDDGARKAARVYKENVAFIKSLEQDAGHEPQATDSPAADAASEPSGANPRLPLQTASTAKMLAQYQIPLGANQVQLIFTGDELTPEDFDALADFVEIIKKQFVRKQTMQVADKTNLTKKANATPT
jgi:hypothetical protein